MTSPETETEPYQMPGLEKTLEVNASVGLSDPQLSGSRRRMLDLVNRLHSTGYVFASLKLLRLLLRGGTECKSI